MELVPLILLFPIYIPSPLHRAGKVPSDFRLCWAASRLLPPLKILVIRTSKWSCSVRVAVEGEEEEEGRVGMEQLLNAAAAAAGTGEEVGREEEEELRRGEAISRLRLLLLPLRLLLPPLHLFPLLQPLLPLLLLPLLQLLLPILLRLLPIPLLLLLLRRLAI